MPPIDIPLLGNLLLCVVLASAAYTFAMALGAGRGRPQLLSAARSGTYATVAFIVVAVALLAYAFQTHDFRIRYVSRYSDRSMPGWYLFASLWGGQDGSMLWWMLLLGGYTGAATAWLKGRYQELQPWILATLMSIIIFFAITMLWAANPFATNVASAPPDGEGLNPLLQNYWMLIHPPSLYLGFVGWSVPFAFVIAALITGRLSDEWIRGARLWAMIAWTFLSIGLLLGCLWSYEELGWGGYWAWDPVENASFMPWLVGTAYLHSAMVQERYGMLKVWNVFLMCLTFWMTIFGTFLTRSGMIASVHSFARSDIGTYFVYYMVFLAIVITGLIVWRLNKLKAEHAIISLLSREFFFLLNNWVLLGIMIFVLGATMWPRISELMGEEATVGAAFYNKWMVPFGIVLLLLTGVGPQIAWRKASGKNLRQAMAKPAIATLVVAGLQLAFGDAVGLPGIVAVDDGDATGASKLLAMMHAVAPLMTVATSTYVTVAILQEFWRGTKVRMKKGEGPLTALVSLVSRARRRYGGYTVHLGLVFMFIGFTGAAYDTEVESVLEPGEAMDIRRVGEVSAEGDERQLAYRLRYERPRTEIDPNKRALYTEMTLLSPDGEEVGAVYPAKFIYRTHPEMPTTEVAIRSQLREDLYVIMSTVDPETERATFRVILRPLVPWIWLGGILSILGCVIAIWPRTKDVLARQEQGRRRNRKAAAAALLLVAFGLQGIAASAVNAQHPATAQSHEATSNEAAQ